MEIITICSCRSVLGPPKNKNISMLAKRLHFCHFRCCEEENIKGLKNIKSWEQKEKDGL